MKIEKIVICGKTFNFKEELPPDFEPTIIDIKQIRKRKYW
jgi:hypothetical protein